MATTSGDGFAAAAAAGRGTQPAGQSREIVSASPGRWLSWRVPVAPLGSSGRRWERPWPSPSSASRRLADVRAAGCCCRCSRRRRQALPPPRVARATRALMHAAGVQPARTDLPVPPRWRRGCRLSPPSLRGCAGLAPGRSARRPPASGWHRGRAQHPASRRPFPRSAPERGVRNRRMLTPARWRAGSARRAWHPGCVRPRGPGRSRTRCRTAWCRGSVRAGQDCSWPARRP